MTEPVYSLLVAHEYIIREIVDAEHHMPDSEWTDGHINGLKEARNRVEQVLMELSDQGPHEEIEDMDLEAVQDLLDKRADEVLGGDVITFEDHEQQR